MTWEQFWYTVVGALALIGARLLDRWLPPHPTTSTTVVVMPHDDDDPPGRHHRREDQ